MFCDARRTDEGQVLRSTVCIIGGGPAGLTLALEFERRGIDTIVLESGGFKPDEAFQIPDSESVPFCFELLRDEGLCLGE